MADEGVKVAKKLTDAGGLLLLVQDSATRDKLKEVQELLVRNADIIKALEDPSSSMGAEGILELNGNLKKVTRIYGEMEASGGAKK